MMRNMFSMKLRRSKILNHYVVTVEIMRIENAGENVLENNILYFCSLFRTKHTYIKWENS